MDRPHQLPVVPVALAAAFVCAHRRGRRALAAGAHRDGGGFGRPGLGHVPFRGALCQTAPLAGHAARAGRRRRGAGAGRRAGVPGHAAAAPRQPGTASRGRCDARRQLLRGLRGICTRWPVRLPHRQRQTQRAADRRQPRRAICAARTRAGAHAARQGPHGVLCDQGSCPPVPGLFSGADTACDARRAAVLDLALQPEIDSVVLGACWSCYFTGVGPAVNYFVDDKKVVHPFQNGDGVDLALQSLGEVLRRLSAAHKKVYLVLGNPVGMDFDPLKQIEGSRLGGMRVSEQGKAPLPEDQAQFNARLKQVAEANGAQVIAPFASLCTDGQCLRSMPDDGSPAYKDIGHLRPRYARSFATYMDPALLDEDAGGK
nr:SGNH hydrolase domain-containing protein [Variovorax paradoxus]